ncbi:Trk system potassium transporter TrkA [Marinilabiliaceae bacterium JC040]|nr:Trk system potassium transporter TrkA [Marinilabiliaceae bacterium JC040]
MDIVIAGAGAVGTHLAHMLSTQDHNIILMDSDENKIAAIESQLDILTILGSCSSVEDLKLAKVNKADLYIAVTQTEEINLTSSIIAKKIGAKKTIARIDNNEYLQEETKKYWKSIGVDHMIYPERLAAEEVIASLKLTGTRQLHEFSGGKIVLYGIKLRENAKILDYTLKDAISTFKMKDTRIVAINRNNNTIIPHGKNSFRNGDLIFVITKPEGINETLALCGKKRVDIKNIIIVGGSRIAKRTAMLLEKQYNVKLIERDRDKCEKLNDVLEDTLVINGDGTDLSLLKSEDIECTDAFVCLTGNSETNILACLLAKKHNVKKSVAEVEHIDYIDLASNLGIGTLINKKLIAASYIYRHTMTSKVEQFKCLTASDAEVFELIAQPNSKITKKCIENLHLPKEANIGGIIRDDETIIPNGQDQIQAGDRVVVFTLPSAMRKVEKFFI